MDNTYDYLFNGEGNDTTPPHDSSTPQQAQGDSQEAPQAMNKDNNNAGNAQQTQTQQEDNLFAKLDSLRHPFDTTRNVKKTEFIGGLFARGYVSVVAGAPGVGKTIFEQRIIHDLSRGGDIFGGFAHEDKPRHSILISGEFKEEGFIERAQAFDWHSDKNFVEVIDTLDFEKKGISFALNDSEGRANLEHVAASCRDVLFLDSLGTLFCGKENDNSEIIKLFSFLMRLASDYNIAIVVIHHSRKRLASEQQRPLTIDDLIGGNGITRYTYSVIAIEYRYDIKTNIVRCLKSWGKIFKPFTYKVKKNLYDNGSYLDINLEPGEIDIDSLTSTNKKQSRELTLTQASLY